MDYNIDCDIPFKLNKIQFVDYNIDCDIAFKSNKIQFVDYNIDWNIRFRIKQYRLKHSDLKPTKYNGDPVQFV